MQPMVTGFAQALDAFMRDLGSLRSRVTVVTISEFGRRVEKNGNRGLDHGNWPWLSSRHLVDGDLAVTTDYRDVLGEIITSRFPDRSISTVFPGLSHPALGLMA
jgi:hypothetical protein